jgi:hypothetical protein
LIEQEGNIMRIKIMAGIAALAIAACSVVATTPAQARWHGHHGGGGWGGPFAGFAAGAIIGGVLAAQQPYYYGPGYYYPPDYAYGPPPPDAAYCMQRFKSYDPGSGTYLGYDGYRHPCP